MVLEIVGVMEEFADLPIPTAIAESLNKMILENDFVYINFWSFTHIYLGIIAMFLVFKFWKKSENKFLILFGILVLAELFEFAFYGTGSTLYRADPRIDTIWDLIVGMFGGYMYCYLRDHKKDIIFPFH